MSFANINDPAAVSALLDQLRASQAWSDLIHQNSNPVPDDAVASPQPSATVATLLSQLQPSTDSAHPSVSSEDVGERTQHTSSALPTEDHSKGPVPVPDLKSYSFQQALPLVAKLSSDPAFTSEVQNLKRAQDDLERRLWEERRAIQREYEEKVKLAKTKASMIGVGLSKHEADMINVAYKKELEKFDRERALPAFDSLVAKQQDALARLNVPTMYVTDDRTAREGQQRVMQVLGGLVAEP